MRPQIDERTVTLLAVDDHQDNLFVLEQIVAEELPGCRVITAGGAKEGLAIANSVPIDGALIDVQMPGMGGIEMCRLLKQDPETRDIHLILVTAHEATGQLKAQGFDAGANDFITKPILNAELIARIKAMLRVRQAEERLLQLNEHLDEEVAARTEQLRQSEQKYRALFQGVSDGLLLADDQGKVVMVNEAICQMLGYSEEELLQLGVPDLHPKEDLPDVLQKFQGILNGKLSQVPELRIKHKDGTLFFAEVNSRTITVDGQEHVMACFRDSTEKRELRTSLAQADRLSSLGMLAAGVAHEINNPLAYVLHNLEAITDDLHTLEEDGHAGPSLHAVSGAASGMLQELQSCADDALEGTRRLKQIARSLATFSRVEQDELTEVKLEEIIECAVSMANNEIKFRARLAREFGDVPPVLASDGRLSQVLLNLLINASHAIPEGAVEENEIRVTTWAEGEDVFVRVSDTGTGIASENIKLLFDPFFTTKGVGVGSGLGLSICRTIVEGFGGQISVESELGKGADFTVRLQAHRPGQETPPEEPKELGPAGPTPRRRVLVVDDEDAIRSVVGRILREHEVTLASSGEQGQAILLEDSSFDLILCDMMMPSMSGMDLHKWLVSHDEVLARRLIFMTGGAFTPKAREYLGDNDIRTLEKPFDVKNLRKLVAEVAGQPGPRG